MRQLFQTNMNVDDLLDQLGGGKPKPASTNHSPGAVNDLLAQIGGASCQSDPSPLASATGDKPIAELAEIKQAQAQQKTARAQAWLDAMSQGGIPLDSFFEILACSYPSRLEAAIEYLDNVNVGYNDLP